MSKHRFFRFLGLAIAGCLVSLQSLVIGILYTLLKTEDTGITYPIRFDD